MADDVPDLRLGCAGWSLPRAQWPHFPPEGSHLERYAARFDAVEIDTSFYRPHRTETYARWAASTPAHFRFAVKLPKTITHEARLNAIDAPLDEFMGQVGGLVTKLLNPVFERMVKDDLRRFEQLIEVGEISTVEGQPSGRAEEGLFGRILHLF